MVNVSKEATIDMDGSDNLGETGLEYLPPEIIKTICSYLNLIEVAKLREVSITLRMNVGHIRSHYLRRLIRKKSKQEDGSLSRRKGTRRRPVGS